MALLFLWIYESLKQAPKRQVTRGNISGLVHVPLSEQYMILSLLHVPATCTLVVYRKPNQQILVQRGNTEQLGNYSQGSGEGFPYEKVGNARRKIWITPLKASNLALPFRALFDSRKVQLETGMTAFFILFPRVVHCEILGRLQVAAFLSRTP